MNPQRLLDRIRRGHLRNIGFDDFTSLLDALGFEFTRTRESHRVYRHEAVQEMLVVQPSKSGEPSPIRSVSSSDSSMGTLFAWRSDEP